jgi:hypothetical protein
MVENPALSRAGHAKHAMLLLDGSAGDVQRAMASADRATRALLASRRHLEPERASRRPTEPGFVPLTVTEIRRLVAKLITTMTRPTALYLAWSRWRRIHQARARTSR